MAATFDRDISGLLRVRDVSRSFTVARAVENPVSTMMKKGEKPKSSLYEWLFRKPHTPADTAVADGQDVTSGDVINNQGNKFMLQGRIQKGWVPYGVGDIAQELVEEYGVKNLLADNAEDAMNLARENLELMVLKNGDSQPETGNTSNTASKLRGLTNWIRSSNPNGGDLIVNTNALTPAANIVTGKAAATDIVETDFRGVMKSIATTSRRSNHTWDVMLTADAKEVFTDFTRTQTVTGDTQVPLRRFNRDQKDSTIGMNVLFYESDHGKLRLHTHYSLPTGVHALILDMTHLKLRPVRAPRRRTARSPRNGRWPFPCPLPGLMPGEGVRKPHKQPLLGDHDYGNDHSRDFSGR
jgi:hypothetical protein